MKRIIFLSLLLVFYFKPVFPQGCLPEGIVFETQEQIDNFENNYPGCTTIEGDVFIGSINGNLNIMNLQGLAAVSQVNGRLDIVGCYSIGDLTGLNSLTLVGGDLEINNCTELDNLSGLNALSQVNGSLKIVGNNILSSLDALASLTMVEGELRIISNATLHTLVGFEQLTSVGMTLFISGNANLVSLSGLQNINPNTLQGYIAIMNNPNLSQCAIQSICEFLELPGVLVFVNNNAPGCYNTSELQTACTTAVDENATASFSLSPNPASSFITIHIKEGIPIEQAIIYNHLGQKVLTTRPIQNAVDVSKLKPGIYIVEVKLNDNLQRTHLIIK